MVATNTSAAGPEARAGVRRPRSGTGLMSATSTKASRRTAAMALRARLAPGESVARSA